MVACEIVWNFTYGACLNMLPLAAVQIHFLCIAQHNVKFHTISVRAAFQDIAELLSSMPFTAHVRVLQAQIKKLEPLLAALAAVPWIDPGAEDGQRVPYIKTAVLDEVEGMGESCRF